ncbi:InlB B-repeat-containing protein [Mycoplasmatota bacterium]|nr:InlB B-repeat-containing protein [Mycoplasmatota bacterium]
MINTKTKKIITINIAILLTLFLSMFLSIDILTEEKSYDQVIYKVENIDEAKLLEENFHLSLSQISSQGIAVFHTSRDTKLESLISYGFAINNKSHIVSPLKINPSNQDPYLEDQYALTMMNTIESWQITEGSSDVLVAIIDTGIDTSHEEFIGRISPLSYNAVTQSVGLEHINDDHGHGTMVAGVIGAEKDNSKGIAGITSHVQLMVIKANLVGEDSFYDSDLIEGIYYAVDQGADIINLSLGGPGFNSLTESAINYARNNGVIVVAASGNDGSNEAFYPAAYESSISVSAVDANGIIASYSNYGDTIDISAPGSDIVTTYINNDYVLTDGTSFASPQVAGVLALMLSYFPDMDRQEIIQRLLQSSLDQGEEGIDDYYGYGLVNTYNALTYDMVQVSFETFDGTNIDPIYQLSDSKLSLPEPPILDGYPFQGWYKDIALTEAWDIDNDIVTEDITLYADFNKDFHEVTFISHHETTKEIFNRGQIISLPQVSLEGYRFIAWTTDIDNLHPYEPSPIYNDLTLYAHFEEIVYFEVSLYIDDLFFETYSVESNQLFEPNTYSKTGHSFDGWYDDANYTHPYDASMPVESNINLYAKFVPDIHTITLFVDGELYQTQDINYGQVPNLPELSKEHYDFLAWYDDQTYQNQYLQTPITEDISLYAYFDKNAYQVTYHLDDQIFTEWQAANQIYEPYTPSKEGHVFIGWYMDPDLTEPYQEMVIDKDINIYGAFEIEYYQVTFYDSDRDTILYQESVPYLGTVSPPDPPSLENSISFSYQFLSWSEDTDNVIKDQFVYPQYERHFIDGSITLEPGVDTLTLQQPWQDASVSELDPFLTLHTKETVDTSTVGNYTVTYSVYDGDTLLVELIRIIRVIPAKLEVIIELNEAVTSLFVGQQYNETGATSSHGQIEIISNVDTTVSGTYRVIYQVEIDGERYQKSRYVHVIESETNTLSQIYWYKEEGDLDVT